MKYFAADKVNAKLQIILDTDTELGVLRF